MSKVFLHLGAHKTATSFIQANLMANKSAFKKQGWRAVYFQKEFRALRKHVLAVRKGKAGDKADGLSELFKGLREDPNNVFFSSEIFLGQMSLGRGSGIYPHHASIVKTLGESFAGRDVKVGFCIRNFADFIESGYSWLVARGKPQSFGRYTKNITPAALSWANIIESFAETFGAENLVLWTYEDFRQDSTLAFLKIIEAAGLDPIDFVVQIEKPRNVSHPPEVIKLIELWNKLMRGPGQELPQPKRKRLKKRFRELMASVPKKKKGDRYFGPERRKKFDARYEEELALIRARWGAQLLDFSQPAQPLKARA